MHGRARFAIPIVLLAVALGGGYWLWNQRASGAVDGVLTGSGTIEAEEVLVTAEIGGRVQELLADEGDEVAALQVLAQLDTALQEAQLAQAEAAVAVAEANLAQLRAGTRSEEITQAEAAVTQAEAAYAGALAAYEHTEAILQRPHELDAQVAQALAARDASRRALERLRAGTRPEDLSAAEAQLMLAQESLEATRDRLSAAKTQAEAQVQQATGALTQAQARYAQAKSNWEYVRETGNDAMMPNLNISTSTGIRQVENEASDGVRENYYSQFVQAEAALHQAETAVEQALVAAEAARQAEASGVRQAESQLQVAEATLAKAEAGPTREDLAQAETALANAQRLYDIMVEMRADPQQLKAAVDAARAQRDVAAAQLAQARARLALAQAGPRAEQIQAAEAALAQARAAQRQVEVQIAKATLTAPRDGIVLSRPIHQGEQVAPGAPLMTLGTLDPARLTIYVSEADIGQVRLGQAVDVTVNSFPGRVFSGTVTFIAQQAEFTPRNVQTADERATTVFAVRVELPNGDHALKPGMPADAVLR